MTCQDAFPFSFAFVGGNYLNLTFDFYRSSDNIVQKKISVSEKKISNFNRCFFVLLHQDNRLHHYHDRRQFQLYLDRVHRCHHHPQPLFSDNYNRENRHRTIFVRIYFISIFDIFDGRPNVVRESDIFPNNRAVVC